jgi:hypothetical protein
LTDSLVEEEVCNILYLYFFFQSLVLIHFYLLELYQDMYSLFQNYMYKFLHIHFHFKAFMILSQILSFFFFISIRILFVCSTSDVNISLTSCNLLPVITTLSVYAMI